MHADLFADLDEPAGFGFAYLDGQTKRSIRRAILKAVAVPGHQTPFTSRELPLPPGWGTGGIQLTATLLVPEDLLKVIDQGADDATNAVAIRAFFTKVAGVATTSATADASIIQTRHRVPETPLNDAQILVLQVPQPEPFRRLIPNEDTTRIMHALADYGLMSVALYESIARHGRIAAAYDHPVLVNQRYLASPSPIPTFDNPKLHHNRALLLFGAGREKRVYAIPPFTDVRSLDFDDYPFVRQRWDRPCVRCGATHTYLDTAGRGPDGQPIYACSDTDYCATHARLYVDQANERKRP